MKARKYNFEKFSETDLNHLRDELLRSGLDSWQAAELISSFLSERGYGVSTQAARKATAHMEVVGCSIKCLQEELEKLAQVM
jgi:hypothetical protein